VLAEYVLRNAPGDWNSAAVDAALCGDKTLRVILTQPVNVVVFYATAAATESRGVLFSEDIYGHDKTLDRLLERAARAR
jgi:L,D-transpeptidase YcbB